MKLSSTYRVRPGDTFELIARQVYGSERDAGLIADGNPGVVEPLTAGTTITIPVVPGTPQNRPQSQPSVDEDETALLIEGERFRFWDGAQIIRQLDSLDRISFDAPFESDESQIRDVLVPFSFKPIRAYVGGQLLFTGTMVDVVPALTATESRVSVSCYSNPGVLNDCTMPASAFPLETNGLKLDQIANTMARPFGLSVDFQGDPGAEFPRVAISPHKKILSFLTELAKQRNYVISNSPEGALRFWRSVPTGNPVAILEQGSSPVQDVTPNFNPQNYFSHVTATAPVFMGGRGSQFTVKNEFLTNVLRPHTFKIKDAITGDERVSAESKAARMFADAASYDVAVSTWRDPQGDLWAPNTTVKLRAPEAMIYNSYEFLVRQVTLDATHNSNTAVLNLVLPGVFSGQLPETLPWVA